MNKQRSAFLGVALAILGAAACEDKTEVVVPPDTDPLQISVTPASLDIQVGQSQQVVAQITGGDSATVKTVQWTSSAPSIASVTANGNVATVTGVAQGVATIRATATADPNVTAAVSVNVRAQGGVPPSISIQSITAGATNLPVNEQNVFGQIEITLNLEVPQGTRVNQVKLLANNVEFYRQTFSSPDLGASADEAQNAAIIVASWNTAEFDRTHPFTVGTRIGKYRNGPTTITAQVIGPQGTITAETSRQIVLNNVPFVFAKIIGPTGGSCTLSAVAGPLAPAGVQWCSGDVVIDAVGVKFDDNASNDVASLTLNGSANTNVTFTDGGAPFTLILQKATTPAASSIAAWEFAGATFTLTGLTTGGQPLSGCIVTDATPAPLNLGCGVLGGSVLLPNPLNVDNVAPAVTVFDMTPDSLPGLACNPNFPVITTPNACYISDAFNFNTQQQVVNGPFFVTSDAGVGFTSSAQPNANVSFRAGTSTSTLVPVTTGASLAESVTANTYIAEGTSNDKLGNTRVVFASTAGTAQTTATGAQQFGVDTTAPIFTIGGPANNSTNPPAAPNAWSLAPTDGGVGPSGFLPQFARVQLERFLPGASATTPTVTCFVPDDAFSGTTASCTSGGAPNMLKDNGVIGVPTGVTFPAPAGVEGYFRLTAYVVDAAWPGNASTTTQQILLNDVTPPVIGGISSPSSLPGGAPATFTAPLGDNVDLGAIAPSIDYGAGPITFQGASVTVGTYGVTDGLVGSATGSWNIPAFMRAVEGTTATGRSDNTVNEATTVRFDVRDVAGNTTTATLGINTAVRFPLTPSGSAVPPLSAVAPSTFAPANVLHGNFLMLAPNPTTVCDGGSSACGSSPPASTVLSATMTGPNATFANPFVRVEFYYQDPVNGRWYLIGNGTAVPTDNTVTSTRTWTYSVTWTVTGLTDSAGNPLSNTGTINLMAVGVHSSGSAVSTTGSPQTVTITAT